MLSEEKSMKNKPSVLSNMENRKVYRLTISSHERQTQSYVIFTDHGKNRQSGNMYIKSNSRCTSGGCLIIWKLNVLLS